MDVRISGSCSICCSRRWIVLVVRRDWRTASWRVFYEERFTSKCNHPFPNLRKGWSDSQSQDARIRRPIHKPRHRTNRPPSPSKKQLRLPPILWPPAPHTLPNIPTNNKPPPTSLLDLSPARSSRNRNRYKRPSQRSGIFHLRPG